MWGGEHIVGRVSFAGQWYGIGWDWIGLDEDDLDGMGWDGGAGREGSGWDWVGRDRMAMRSSRLED